MPFLRKRRTKPLRLYVVSDIHGRPLAYNNAHAVQPSLVAANAGLHAQIIGLLRQ